MRPIDGYNKIVNKFPESHEEIIDFLNDATEKCGHAFISYLYSDQGCVLDSEVKQILACTDFGQAKKLMKGFYEAKAFYKN
jgi:hypothetical protein